MNTKSKIMISVSVACLVLAVTILAVVAVWAVSRQEFTTSFHIRYTAQEVRGTATAQWKLGENGAWNSMTVGGNTNGDTVLRFDHDELSNVELKPVEDVIDLTEDDNFIVFKYTFTNATSLAYAVDLFYTDDSVADTNIQVYTYSSTTELTSKFEDTINTSYGDWTTGHVPGNGSYYIYILGKIISTSKDTSYSGSFDFKLDGKDYTSSLDIQNGAVTGVTSNLSTIRIPDGVTSISATTFTNNTTLTEIIIPDSVNTIASGAFTGCTKLKYMQIPFVGGSRTSNKYFAYIFGATSSTNQDSSIPTSLTNVIVSGGNIPDNAFYQCGGLKSITIPSSATSIGSNAFWYCSGLTSITIPSKVTSIGTYAFRQCGGLTSIKVDPANGTYTSRNSTGTTEHNCIIEKSSQTLKLGCKTTTIPDDGSVTSIGSYAFYECSGLTSITIPSKVTSIGDYAFRLCSGLTSITIDSPDIYKALTGTAYNVCGQLLSNISSGEKVYVLTSVVNGNSNTYINSTSWYSSKTTSGDYTVFTKK